MPTLEIDGQTVEVPEGATLLDAARTLGIDIPALCYRDGWEPNTTCMACLVKLMPRGVIVPSCATAAEEGMVVESETDEVRDLRRNAIELLLSDHLGDCMAPCHSVCPARMDIPTMIRQIAAGELADAIVTVKADIPLPAVLGRICPAPCEKGCRRGEHDAPVAICLLKRYVADVDLARDEPFLPEKAPPSGKRVGIVGAGPTGLSAAYYLLAAGHEVTVIDERPLAGGMLRYGIEDDELDPDVVAAEVAVIQRLGADFRTGVRVGRDVPMADVRGEFDAVFVAAGKTDQAEAQALGLPWAGKTGVAADRHTCATEVEGVFAACSPRQQKLAVRAVAAGKGGAASIDQFLRGREVTGEKRPFTVHIGKLQEGEIQRFLPEAEDRRRVEPAQPTAGFAEGEAVAESARCLHCDCRCPHDCKLRDYADAYGASTSKYKAGRQTFEQVRQHAGVLYEPGKCIGCGLCVQTARRAGEEVGLAFVGRGFDVRVAVPFDRSLSEGLAVAAAECVEACPTGALAFRDDSERAERPTD